MLDILRRVWRSPSGRIGLVATLIVVLGGLLAPVIATHMPNQIDVANRLTPPSASHWLGADNLGRDLYSRGLYGTRVAVGVALAVTATALVLGIFLGVAAAYAPSPIESLILAAFDIISSYPSLILALALVAVLGPGLINIIILVTVVFIPQFGRVARAQTMTIKERPFLEAERALGASGRAHRVLPRPAQHHRADRRTGEHADPRGHHAGGRLELSRRRHPAAAGKLGLDAVRWIHPYRAVRLAGFGSGRHADARHARLHSVRRGAARCDRSQAEARTMTSGALVAIENLSVDFETANGPLHVLRDVSLAIGRRQIWPCRRER